MPEKSQAPSEAFIEAFMNESSIGMITCESCDRVYFVRDKTYDWKSGELERVIELSEETPDRYIELNDSIRWGVIGGKQYVVGCKCNGIREHEDIIWANHYEIAAYLELRAAKQLREATQDSKLTQEVSTSIQTLE